MHCCKTVGINMQAFLWELGLQSATFLSPVMLRRRLLRRMGTQLQMWTRRWRSLRAGTTPSPGSWGQGQAIIARKHRPLFRQTL